MIHTIFTLLFGLMFVLFGLFIPRCEPNLYAGVRVKWTLGSPANWKATHRFAGYVWIIGGILMMLCALLPTELAALGWILGLTVLCAAPIVYSYRYYLGEKAAGTLPAAPHIPVSRGQTVVVILTLALVAISLLTLPIFLLTGEIEFHHTDAALTVEADFWTDLTLEYSRIRTVTLREDVIVGRRAAGFGSDRLLMGRFQNEEFGPYIRYTYAQSPTAVVVETDTETFVFAAKDIETTKALYDALLTRIPGDNSPT